MITEALKEHLKNMPDKKKVWLNEKGEWMHYKHPDFPTEMTREEVLEADDEAKGEAQYSRMNVAALKGELTERGIEFSSTAVKKDMIALLEADDEAKNN